MDGPGVGHQLRRRLLPQSFLHARRKQLRLLQGVLALAVRPDSRVPPVDSSRDRGHRGGVIAMHRALAHFQLGRMNLLTSFSLLVCFSWMWILVLPRLCHFWEKLLVMSLRYLPIRGTLEIAEHRFTPSYVLDV